LRIKLDENISTSAAAVGTSLGHDVDIVEDEGLAGRDDADVMAAVRREGRFLITLDRGLADIRLYPPGSHPGIAVLRLDSQDALSVTSAVRSLLARDDFDQLAGCVLVIRGNLVRIRRPQ
jgi:predicted nuclease of predicted toxin-antitoxin system